MILISVLIGLILDRRVPQLHRIRHYVWLQQCSDWVQKKFDTGPSLLLVVLPPALLAALLQATLSGGLMNLPGLLFGTFILLACLGPRDLPADVAEFQAQLEGEDAEGIARAAQQITEHPLRREDVHLASQVSNSIFAEANNRHFAVLFWFIVLGPMGAVLYRGAEVVHQHTVTGHSSYSEAAWRLVYLLEWLPAHLLAFAYALSGHFDGAVEAWSMHRNDAALLGRDANRSLLMRTGTGALGSLAEDAGEAAAVGRAMALVWRAAIVWLVALALLTLVGWLA